MNNITAIQTEYKGYLFRSRLEARWAVFFDILGIEWIYEPEGLILLDGTHYLPDFFLLDFRCYFEVKGRDIKGTEKERAAIRKISAGMDSNSWVGLICFGDPMDDELYVFCQETDDGGGGSYESRVTIGFSPETRKPCLFSFEDWRDRAFFTCLGEDMEDIAMTTDEYGKYKYEDFVTGKVLYARKRARQARFEYGETPRIRRTRHA